MTKPIILKGKLYDLLTQISKAKDEDVAGILYRDAKITPSQFKVFMEEEGILGDEDAKKMLVTLEKAAGKTTETKTKNEAIKIVGGKRYIDVEEISRGDISNKFTKQAAVNVSNKASLVAHLAEGAGITKIQANAVLNSLVEAITRTLKRGGKVTLIGFGTFSVTKRAARNGRNPQTGAVIKIKAAKVAKFKAAKELSNKI